MLYNRVKRAFDLTIFGNIKLKLKMKRELGCVSKSENLKIVYPTLKKTIGRIKDKLFAKINDRVAFVYFL